MKKIQKTSIIVLSTLCAVIMFVGLPNFASGEIQDGSVELNNGVVSVEKLFDEEQRLAPSQVISSKKIKISNTGSLPLEMYEKFLISLKQDGFSKSELSKMIDKYFIKAHFYKNDKEIVVNGLTKEWINGSEFNATFNEEKGKAIGKLKPNETLSLVLDVKLAEGAGNEYQGALFTIDLVAGGVMSIAEDGLLLPDTATSYFQILCIGLVLILASSIFYLRVRRFQSDNRK
jgi:hypothetical protein